MACQAVLGLITAHAEQPTKPVALITATQTQPASAVRRMGRRRDAFTGKSREHPKTDQASWRHRAHAHAKSDSVRIFSTTSKHSHRAFIFELHQMSERVYSLAPQILVSMQ